MFTVERVHSSYLVIRDGSFLILYVNIDKNGTVVVTTPEEGITLQQLLSAIAILTEHLEIK